MHNMIWKKIIFCDRMSLWIVSNIIMKNLLYDRCSGWTTGCYIMHCRPDSHTLITRSKRERVGRFGWLVHSCRLITAPNQTDTKGTRNNSLCDLPVATRPPALCESKSLYNDDNPMECTVLCLWCADGGYVPSSAQYICQVQLGRQVKPS